MMLKKKSASASGLVKAPGKKGGPKRARRGRKKKLPRLGLYPALAFLAAMLLLAGLWLWLKESQTAASPSTRTAATGHNASSARGADADATILRVLVDMAGLPYEESLAAPLEENVKQVDYALVQAMLRLGMRPADTVIEKTELRHGRKGQAASGDGGLYHFQRLRIAVGSDPLSFVSALRESLRAWADRAELVRLSPGRRDQSVWAVNVGGTPTHELVLFTKTGEPPAVPSPIPSASGPRRVQRQRLPGEPAYLVLVMDDLGQSMPAVRQLLALPYPVTFAIWPDSGHAREADFEAHAAGREIIVHQPMEPLGYPKIKPGPGALLHGATDASIEEQIRLALAKVPHAVGLNNHMGSRFTQNRAGVGAVLRVLREKKLLALDSMTHPASVLYGEATRMGLPALKRDVFLDVTARKEAVLRQLRIAEKVALLTGRAIAIGHPLPETLAALKEWGSIRNLQVSMARLTDLAERSEAP